MKLLPLYQKIKNKQSWIVHTLAWLLIALGAWFRMDQYLFNRSLWLDEALLANNLVQRSFLELLQPLDNNQGAPVGFLWAERAVMAILGNRDLWLRLIPLFAGLISLVLIYRLSVYLFHNFSMLIPVGLFAFSDTLIYQASELKQYSSDVAIVLLLLVLVVGILTQKNPSTARYISLGLIGAGTIWFSHPAVFILAAIGSVLFLSGYKNRDWKLLANTTIIVLVWTISLGLVYLVNLRQLASNSVLINFWADYFMPIPPWKNLAWFPQSICGWMNLPSGLPDCKISSVLFIVGIVSMFARSWQFGLILSLPFVFTLIASGFEYYPFGSRLSLFLVPAGYFLVAESIERLRSLVATTRFSWLTPVAWGMPVIFLFFQPSPQAFRYLQAPRQVEEVRQILFSYSTDHQPGDLLCVHTDTRAVFEYYAPALELKADCIIDSPMISNLNRTIADLKKRNSSGRVWVLFSHIKDPSNHDDRKLFAESIGQYAELVKKYKSKGAYFYLIDFFPES